MIFQDINQALMARLSTVTGLPAVAPQNSTFTPVAGTPWVRATVMPAQNDHISVGMLDLSYNGILQVDLFYPAGQGNKTALEMAESIAAHFFDGTAMTAGDACVVARLPYLLTAYNDGAWYIQPLRIPYEGTK